ncbi:hypothetical protein ABT009_19590 [Streptomyces sp. NPDC002896]
MQLAAEGGEISRRAADGDQVVSRNRVEIAAWAWQTGHARPGA